MILGFELVNRTYTVGTVLGLLSADSHIFSLTGSRFFGNATAVSDWDFFVLNSKSVRNFLESIGFSEISTEEMVDLGYDRSQFSHIYELKCSDGVIQVQCVQDCVGKKIAQEKIKEFLLEDFVKMDKEQRKRLWTLVLNSISC